MVGIFDCGGVLGKYEIRLKERKVVNMEALNTYKTEKTLAEQMNERLAEMKMTKAEAALKMNYSRAALSQYLNGKYASDPTELLHPMVQGRRYPERSNHLWSNGREPLGRRRSRS